MVASPHALASQSGLAVLREGGNAVDAAIAAAATIAVVYPHMNGVGGDNFWLIHDGRAGRVRALCGAGRSAAAASIGWYAARGATEAIPTRGGPAALAVPGAVDGWWEAHRFSRAALASPIGWPRLLEDAIAYAAEGFSPSRSQRTPPPREPDLFGKGALDQVRRGLWPSYHPDALASGLLVQRDLARTLEAIRDGGPDGFYRGEVARRVCAALAGAGSPLEAADFSDHRSEWVEPLRLAFAGGEALSFPPPTQGMSALAILAMAERFDLGALGESDYVHVLVEATKLAFVDRDRHLTDPAAMRVSPAELLAPERLARVATLISRRRAMAPEAAAAAIDGLFAPGTSGAPAASPAAGGDTIAIVTADAQGNAVSLIQSLYFTYGSGLVAGDTGVILQNRGSFFSLDPRQTNALAPRKLTMHTLIPGMYLRDGGARFVSGTMGGEGQPQTQAALLTRRLLRGLGAQACVEAPRWLYGRTWGAATRALSAEGRYPAELVRDLEARGHRDVRMGGEWDDLFGHAQCIWIARQGGALTGGSDPRADGAALGF
jgi:gamma-glutamyltranspeptidase/glutathione hydrolase